MQRSKRSFGLGFVQERLASDVEAPNQGFRHANYLPAQYELPHPSQAAVAKPGIVGACDTQAYSSNLSSGFTEEHES